VTSERSRNLTMRTTLTVRLVDFCVRHCRLVVAAGTLLLIVAAAYDAARFSITTNVDALISRDLPWHRRQLAFTEAFPQKGILVVVGATTPENATLAANALAQQISRRPDLFRSVAQTDGEFFERNGFLFESVADVEKSIGGLKQAQPLLSELAGDPTLHGR
jgi:uncharacterized protein